MILLQGFAIGRGSLFLALAHSGILISTGKWIQNAHDTLKKVVYDQIHKTWNALDQNTSMHILHTFLYISPKLLTWRICLTINSSLLDDHFLYFCDLNVHSGVKLSEEIRCQSLLWIKRLTKICKLSLSFILFTIAELLLWGRVGNSEQST